MHNLQWKQDPDLFCSEQCLKQYTPHRKIMLVFYVHRSLILLMTGNLTCKLHSKMACVVYITNSNFLMATGNLGPKPLTLYSLMVEKQPFLLIPTGIVFLFTFSVTGRQFLSHMHKHFFNNASKKCQLSNSFENQRLASKYMYSTGIKISFYFMDYEIYALLVISSRQPPCPCTH